MVIRRKKGLLKKLQSIRKKGTFEIYYEDEVHFQRTTTIIREWSLKGVPTEIKSPAVKEKVSLFGAMGADNGQLITMESKIFCAISFRKFIEKVLAMTLTEKKILLVLDNARFHHAKINTDFLEQVKSRIELVFLPAYSPDLNPIEFLWKKTRREVTHNKYFDSLTELQMGLIQFFKKFRNENTILTKLSANI